jgi:hypothetical protein
MVNYVCARCVMSEYSRSWCSLMPSGQSCHIWRRAMSPALVLDGPTRRTASSSAGAFRETQAHLLAAKEYTRAATPPGNRTSSGSRCDPWMRTRSCLGSSPCGMSHLLGFVRRAAARCRLRPGRRRCCSIAVFQVAVHRRSSDWQRQREVVPMAASK